MSERLIREFWGAMGSNDFVHASEWLHPEFEYYMPQTCEYLRGKTAFAALNHGYPAEGQWSFAVQSVVADGQNAVSDVKITDGSMRARAITFHRLRDGLILRQKEYWPDDYPAPGWRKPWVQVVTTPPF